MKYEITGFLKMSEVDNYEEGCQCFGGSESYFDYSIKAETKEELTKKLKDFLGDDCEPEFNVCDEEGRIDIQRTENDDGDEPTETQWADFRAGRINLWAVTYSAICYNVERTLSQFNQDNPK